MRKAYLLVVLLVLTGCRGTKEIVREVPVYIRDTVRQTQVQRDSIYVDRWHTQYQKGDTVYITDEVTKTVTKIVRDTTREVVETPVEVTMTETKEVEKPLSKLHKCVFFSGVCALFAIFAWITVRIFRFFRKK